MNVLILGSGGREHALAWKLAQSTLLSELFIAPGNAGTESAGINVDISPGDFDAISRFCKERNINMVVVGPEAPLADGIHNYLKGKNTTGLTVIGPPKEGALLESSKDFAKDFMARHGIPTGKHRTFHRSNIDEGIEYLKSQKPPYVLKADGLAAGKGVLICPAFEEASSELRKMIVNEKFGQAGKKVIIEEYLEGIEISVFVLTDGDHYKILPSAKDYKRIGEGDTGLNTGGMGSISPVPFADDNFMKKVEDRIIRPTVEGLKKDRIPYNGFIFFGLMNKNGDPYVIEYNVRMGDPEAESVIPRIKTDLLKAFIAISEKKLNDLSFELDQRYCSAIMLVSGGYPEKYEKGKVITGLNHITDSMVFHAGSKKDGETGRYLTSGGRVVAISSFGSTLQESLSRSYENARRVSFEKKYYRTDLGKDLFKYTV